MEQTSQVYTQEGNYLKPTSEVGADASAVARRRLLLARMLRRRREAQKAAEAKGSGNPLLRLAAIIMRIAASNDERPGWRLSRMIQPRTRWMRFTSEILRRQYAVRR